MAFVEVHPWGRLLVGLLAGFWVGVAVGCAGALLIIGSRVRRLETTNLLLRAKLRMREKVQRPAKAPGPVLVARNGERPTLSRIGNVR